MKSIYHQNNRMFQTWFWITYIPVILLLLLHFSKPNEYTKAYIVFIFALVLLPLALLLLMRFILTIDKEKITYQFFPIQVTSSRFLWSEIESAQLVFFDPLKHYWGYGYRKSKKYGRAYVTKGNIGLLIKTKNRLSLNFEITDQTEFSRFVEENQLDQINLDIINIEKMFQPG
jgi:hypothetical protein